ncbi:MAG: hypothetical protein K2W95_20900 [Candidatus Obscuribacterales bacterium]|nr:hypothetical protein [Candidatus Obscuribacterales bacterium]
MSNHAIEPEQRPVKSHLSDEQAKATAKELYMGMRVARMARIAKAVGRSLEIVEQWKTDDEWMIERHLKRKEQKDIIMKAYGDVFDYAKANAETLELCQHIMRFAKAAFENKAGMPPADLKMYADTLRILAEVQARVMKRLGLK